MHITATRDAIQVARHKHAPEQMLAAAPRDLPSRCVPFVEHLAGVDKAAPSLRVLFGKPSRSSPLGLFGAPAQWGKDKAEAQQRQGPDRTSLVQGLLLSLLLC